MASENQSYRAGETKGQAEAKTGQVIDKTKDTKDKTGSYLSEKAEQVKTMAQGAAEKVKDTFGMAGSGEDDDIYDDEDLWGGNTASAAKTTTTTRKNKNTES